VHTLRLSCRTVTVDVRVTGMNARWIAVADTPEGPSLGLGWTPRRALMQALEPFEGVVDDLLLTVPADVLEHGALG
jgi:hypothetical protein